MREPVVAGLLLAAGGGRRMGVPKALVRFEGRLLVERGVSLLSDGGCHPIVVVLGASAQQVQAQAQLRPAEAVVNAGWRSGMGSSVGRGLQALEGRADAVVVALVDQPLITPATVHRLIDAWRGSGQAAVVATYRGQLRNPVVLDASVWPEVIATAQADSGARAWIAANPGLVQRVACDDTGRADDLDTPEDLAALTAGDDPDTS